MKGVFFIMWKWIIDTILKILIVGTDIIIITLIAISFYIFPVKEQIMKQIKSKNKENKIKLVDDNPDDYDLKRRINKAKYYIKELSSRLEKHNEDSCSHEKNLIKEANKFIEEEI